MKTDDPKPTGYDTLREAVAAIIEHEKQREQSAKPGRERLGLNFKSAHKGRATAD
ncbi:MAG: hypothetical protein ACXWBP_03075 [Limisphaerales bacterium]